MYNKKKSRLHVDVTQNKAFFDDLAQLICMYGQSLRGLVVITQAVLSDPGLLSWAEREEWFPLWSN